MPNRIIREGILTSERVNSLGAAAELFYRRLMSVVDDFGRFDARPAILRASCYPLKVDSIREADISRSLEECQSAGLLALYEVNGKPYVEVLDFRQQVRAKTSKYPSRDGRTNNTCTADAMHMRSTCAAHAHLDGGGDGDEKININAGARTPTLDEVKQVGTLAGIPSDHAEAFYNAVESRPFTPDGGWTMHNGQPMNMSRWRNALAAYSASMNRNTSPKRGEKKKALPSKWDDEF